MKIPNRIKNTAGSSLLVTCLASIVVGLAASSAYGQARNAYYTIQPNATKDAFVHTISWVALDSQHSGSSYDNPATTGVNEGDKDFINNNDSFGNFGSSGGSAFEIHSKDDPLGQTRYEYLPGVEVRYQPPHAGGTNSYAGGYVYLGTDGSDGAASSPVGNSTPKWENVGSFSTEPNGMYGIGWDGVTGFRTVSPDGTGIQITGDGLYIDSDDVTGGGLAAPTDDVGMALVGFDAATQAAPQTGYMQFVIPTATRDFDNDPLTPDTQASTDLYFNDPNGFWPESGWKAAYVAGVHTDNASIEVTVTSDSSYTAKLAISGDFDGDLDIDNSDIITAAGGFTGSAGSGEEFGQYYRNGDVNGDGDVDNSDIIMIAGNFTGAAAGSTIDTAAPNLVYDPVTGNVTLDSDGGNNITGFQLESVGVFLDGNYTSPGGGYGGAFEDISNSVIADSDLSFVGLASLDLGNILASGLTITELESLLTTADYGAGLGNSGEFDLVLIPEPSSTALFGIAVLGVILRRRRS